MEKNKSIKTLTCPKNTEKVHLSMTCIYHVLKKDITKDQGKKGTF